VYKLADRRLVGKGAGHRERKSPIHSSVIPYTITPECDQRHFPKFKHRVHRLEIANFSHTFSRSTVYTLIQTVCGWEGVEGFESCCRPYSAGVVHSVSDKIQNLQNCSTTPRQKSRRGGGIRLFFNDEHFAVHCISLIFLRDGLR
jgi:hypothetical protein